MNLKGLPIFLNKFKYYKAEVELNMAKRNFYYICFWFEVWSY